MPLLPTIERLPARVDQTSGGIMSADRDEILNALSVALVTLEAVGEYRNVPQDLRTFAERATVRLLEVTERLRGSAVPQGSQLPNEVAELEWFGKTRCHT